MQLRIYPLILGLPVLLSLTCCKPVNERKALPVDPTPTPAKGRAKATPTPKPTPEPTPEPEDLVELPTSYVSAKSYKLILDFEVGGGKAYFDRYLSRPTWPGASSGVTIGIGYDLGYNSEKDIRSDWYMLDAKTLNRLVAVRGITGSKAKPLIKGLSDIKISWEDAEKVFNETSLKKFTLLARRTYKDDILRESAQGALVSLTFNRGTSMTGDRRREMRAIRDLVPKMQYMPISEQFRLMKRIWRGTSVEKGLSRRRDAEADLVLDYEN